MNKEVGAELLAYSLSVLALAVLNHFVGPGTARTTVIVGLAGAALCTVFALAAYTGAKGKTLPLMTLISISIVLLWEAIHLIWLRPDLEESGGRSTGVVALVMLFLSIAMMMIIASARALDPVGASAANSSHPGTKQQNRKDSSDLI